MRYEYKCKDCNKEFEIVAPIGTVILADILCPSCRGNNILRRWFAPNIIYNADGFTKKVDKE